MIQCPFPCGLVLCGRIALCQGKKAIPGDWIDILCDYYHLKPYPRQILEDAAEASKIRIKIDLKGVLLYKRDLAVVFEKYFDQIDESSADSIMKILNGS